MWDFYMLNFHVHLKVQTGLHIYVFSNENYAVMIEISKPYLESWKLMMHVSVTESMNGQLDNSFSIFTFQIENLDPLVRRAIAAATALPDLQGKYSFFR